MSHHVHQKDRLKLHRAFIIGIYLNLGFVIFEVSSGLLSNSLSLLTDAFHNLGDVAGLALSLFAYRLSYRKSTERFTYGFKKSTILVSIINVIILMIAIGAVGYESIHRLFQPQPVAEKTVILVAMLGIFVNTVSAMLFYKAKKKDLNIRSAFLHLSADAVVSLGVVIAAIIIYFTGQLIIDPIVSILIILTIIRSSYLILKEGVKLSLDAVPRGIDIAIIREKIKGINGVESIHDLHIWPMSTTETALTVHIVLSGNPDIISSNKIKAKINNMLNEEGIFHTAIDFEHADNPCEQHDC